MNDTKTFAQSLIDFIYRNLWAILVIIISAFVFASGTNTRIEAQDAKIINLETLNEKILLKLDTIEKSTTILETNYTNISDDISEIKEAIKGN